MRAFSRCRIENAFAADPRAARFRPRPCRHKFLPASDEKFAARLDVIERGGVADAGSVMNRPQSQVGFGIDEDAVKSPPSPIVL